MRAGRRGRVRLRSVGDLGWETRLESRRDPGQLRTAAARRGDLPDFKKCNKNNQDAEQVYLVSYHLGTKRKKKRGGGNVFVHVCKCIRYFSSGGAGRPGEKGMREGFSLRAVFVF